MAAIVLCPGWLEVSALVLGDTIANPPPGPGFGKPGAVTKAERPPELATADRGMCAAKSFSSSH